MTAVHRLAILLVQIVFYLDLLPTTCAAIETYNSKDGASSYSQLTLPPAQHQRPLRPASDHEVEYDSVTGVAILEDLRKALDVMQGTWFEIWVGTWPTGIDWTRAVLDTYLASALSTLSTALHDAENAGNVSRVEATQIRNDINGYFGQNVAYYFGENTFSLRNQGWDDILWVVLAWLEGIKFVEKHSRLHFGPVDADANASTTRPWHGSQFISAFAHRARVFYEVGSQGWDDHYCGGGMIWNRRSAPYKNAITNELFITASIGMYLHFPGDNNTSPFALDDIRLTELEPVVPHDDDYLKAAIDGYDWLKNSNMTNAQGLYVDGYHIRHWRINGTKCDERNEMVYTYNQGVLLSGLRDLWESTGNQTYLDDGHELARSTIRATAWSLEDEKNVTRPGKWAGMGRDGILEDRCDALGSCSQDSQTFKGIFFHHLSLLCEPLPSKARVPGKTYHADKALSSQHRQRCQGYAPWIAHNVKAALNTRDKDGKFGAWWGARYDAEGQPLPNGAKDYRNNISELLQPLWFPRTQTWSFAASQMPLLDLTGSDGEAETLEAASTRSSKSKNLDAGFDWNDRGRGRTVETQGGGVSILSALWKVMNLA